ncbi:MAG TPA: SRPBCC domain-containing protein [Actinocrinis sp.]|nr:SRPBCC domain-containing protein [Actinocrinis sp.]
MTVNANANMHEQPVVRLQRRIPAPPDRVYRAWLDPDQLRRWLAPGDLEVTRVEIDERVGGRLRIWQAAAGEDAGGFECELLELVPAERIVFRWSFVGPNRLDGPVYDSLLTIDLEGRPDGNTELTLVHERLEKLRATMPDVANAVEVGWEIVLDKLSVVSVR